MEAARPWPPLAETHVKQLVDAGTKAALVAIEGQGYLHVEEIEARGGAWTPESVEILIPMPASYDDAALDAFYLKLPYTFNGGTHSRVQGAIIRWNNSQWQLVSWHYLENQPWLPGRDSIETHLFHCRGFFNQRRAQGDY